MKIKQGTRITTGNQGYLDFYIPRNHTVTAIQIQDEHTYPLYVRIEYYPDLGEEYPFILFANFLRANSTYYNIPAVALNFPVDDEKGIIRVNMLNESGATVTPIVHILYKEGMTASYPNHYNPEDHRGVWAYDQLIERHTNAGAIEVNFTPAPGSWFEIEMIHLAAGFSGAEDVTIIVEDSAGGIVKLLSEINTTTGTWDIPILATSEEDNTASTAASIGKTQDTLRITYPDSLNITTSAVPATDDILVRMRCKLKDQIPTITYTGNTQAQAGYVNDYSVVI